MGSGEREKQIVRWLDMIKADADEIFLVGDVFDFWFEYKSVVPKGFTRLLGKLAELSDQGIPISIFTGNHDMWLFSYFPEELKIPVYRDPIIREWNGKHFYIGHGDGLGPGDKGYKFIKRVFANPVCQWLFARLHPNFAFWLAQFWSKASRKYAHIKDTFKGKENEWLVTFANDLIKRKDIDYFVFGHRHLPIDCLLENRKSRYINLGDWLQFNSYAVFDEAQLEIRFFENTNGKVIHI
jgi:UDP-2,3-diacylglucosamine hydrolase